MKCLSNLKVEPMSADDRLILREIIEREQRDNARRSSVSKYFEFFSAEQVLKKRECDLDPEEIRSGIVGGADDGGVDSMYLFVNERLIREDDDIVSFKDQHLHINLLILQSKYKDTFSEAAIQKLDDFTENCLRLELTKTKIITSLYSESIVESVNKFKNLYKISLTKRPSLSITYFYISLGEDVHPKVNSRAQLLTQKCSGFFSSASVDFEFIGASKLFGLYNRIPVKTIPLKTSKVMPTSSFGTAQICLVPLQSFYEFITENGKIRNHLFESNVRGYQGDVTVNKEIAATLADEGPEEFWWLNNGVTIIASKVIGAGEDLVITDPLIVNGLQTSYKIHAHFQNGHKEDKRNIMVRVIENTNLQSIDKIIKATNSQTKVDRIYLHATEVVHRKIEQALKNADLYYDRRKNHYRMIGIPASKIITLPFLAQAVAAILLQKPHEARSRPTTVADKNYRSIFSDTLPVTMYVRCAQIVKKVDEVLDGDPDIHDYTKYNLLFYVSMLATCFAIKKAKPKPQDIAALQIDDVTEEIIDCALIEVQPSYKKHGGNDFAARKPMLTEALRTILEHKFIAPLRLSPGISQPLPRNK